MKNANLVKALEELEKSNIDELGDRENESRLSDKKTREILNAIENNERKDDEALKTRMPVRKSSRLLRRLPVAVILIALITSALMIFSGAFSDKSETNPNKEFVPLFDNNPYYIYESLLGPTLVNMDECSVTVIDEIPEVYKDSRFYGPFHFYSNTIALAVRSRNRIRLLQKLKERRRLQSGHDVFFR
ncbi:MAG: hypothetical protein E7665_02240 [Ruminococcaceae bacterium]|nr:hypothetical protein [Oscillospiraceae bacterium]